MSEFLKNQKGFLSLMGLLLALVLGCFATYYLYQVYYQNPSTQRRLEQVAPPDIPGESNDTTSVLRSMLKQVEKIEKQQHESADQVLPQMKGAGF